MKKDTKKKQPDESAKLREALEALEAEKNIDKNIILDAIGEAMEKTLRDSQDAMYENVRVVVDKDTCEFHIYVDKEVVDEVYDSDIEIALTDALLFKPDAQIGEIITCEIKPKNFTRILASNAKNQLVQKIREEEKNSTFRFFAEKKEDIMTGIVLGHDGENLNIDLGKEQVTLMKNEMCRGEYYAPKDRIKVYVVEVRDGKRGPKVVVSRKRAELVKRLFEYEVPEIQQGIVEIKGISREEGSRTKMAVWSKDPSIDPRGACIGINGTRVNNVIEEINGEKIDIFCWDENPAILIENALSPAKVIGVWADEEDNTAKVIVPDNQLSLAIGKEGQNARLAAKLTKYRIDIKSESQAREEGLFEELGYTGEEEYEGYIGDEEYEEGYDEEYEGEYEEEDENSEASSGEGSKDGEES